MKKLARKKSKRISTRQRVKTEKKVREYNRKVRKDKKKHPEKFQNRSKKDPGVPNECPFKEKIMQEVEEAKQRKVDEKQKRREQLMLARQNARTKAMEDRRNMGLEGLVADAAKKQGVHESNLKFREELKHKVTDKSAKAFYKEFVKVIDGADVVLQVLDARDPMGTRCKEVEMAVLDASKRLVLVLNKADLVPKENLESWIKYLRAELPTIAFKSSTQNQASRLGHSKTTIEKSKENDLQTSKCVGASTLMSLLSNYCRNKDIKTSIRVGVVGLPNVGKSSLINSLKRARACNVGATPGVTKTMQEVNLDSKIKLLDSPGMILASGNMTDAGVALRNAVKVDTMEDPVTPVGAILQRCPKQQLMLHYCISDYSDINEFLSLVSRHIGKLKKGGIPDQTMAARLVLNDWNMGKLKYYTHPPEVETRATHISAEIVAEFSKEFSLNNLDEMSAGDMESLPTVLPSDTSLILSSGMVSEASKEESMETSEEESNEEDGDVENEAQLPNRMVIAAPTQKQTKRLSDKSPKFVSEGLLRLKKANKLREKKAKKDARRREKVGSELAACFDKL